MKSIIDQAPFDVLRATEMRFNLSAYALKLQNLLIRQRLPVLFLRLNLLFFRTAIFQGIHSQLLGGYLLIDNLAVTHFIDISIYQARDQCFSESKTGID